MSVAALLPMKGHSERIPRKNMKLLAGRPLCYYMLHNLSRSECIDTVVVNTDCENIAAYIESDFPGVKINWRAQNLIGDFVPMNKIIEQDVSAFPADIYLQTHSTNPFLKHPTIDAALSKYKKALGEGYDSMFSISPVYSRLYWENMIPINHNPSVLLRTQDLPKVCLENSLMYFFTASSFLENNGKRIGANPLLFSTKKIESIDIDTPEDFEMAELCAKRLLNEPEG